MAVPETKTTGPAPGAVAPGDGTGSTPAATVAGSGRPDKSFLPLAGVFGKRKRDDGLPPGSGAAQVADREKERKRKADYRESKRAAEPPPILPAPVAKPGQPAPAPGNPAAAVPGSAPVNGMAPISGVPGEVSAPIVLWSAPDLTPVTDAAVPLMEEILHTKKLGKLRAAKIDAEKIKVIEKDFAWPEKSKAMLSKTGAALGAKYLNKVGVSAAYKDEVNFGMALLVIMRMEAAIDGRLDKLIAAAEKAAASPAISNGPAVPTASVSAPGTQPVPAAPASLFPTDVLPDGKTTGKK